MMLPRFKYCCDKCFEPMILALNATESLSETYRCGNECNRMYVRELGYFTLDANRKVTLIKAVPCCDSTHYAYVDTVGGYKCPNESSGKSTKSETTEP